MGDLRELYQEVILDHGRHPRHFGKLAFATHSKEGYNPLCGDQITLYVEENAGVLTNIRFEGCGCAISMASSSLMAESLQGQTKVTAMEMFQLFHQLVTNGLLTEIQLERLGKLKVLQGVLEFPLRVKCATLAWHTLNAILNNDTTTVSTES